MLTNPDEEKVLLSELASLAELRQGKALLEWLARRREQIERCAIRKAEDNAHERGRGAGASSG